jgi:CDP-paratose 2-epimerase
MKVLITGGAGFIGCNLADYHLRRGDEVVLFDNLSRKGADSNLEWLRERHGNFLNFVKGDIRNFEELVSALSSDLARVYHMAGQVAVTTSVTNPREDFEINALGTFNVLEAVRVAAPQAIVLFSSTNKVYGGIENLMVAEEDTRYSYLGQPHGVSELQPLDFHSPYGCSKGAGDQYVRDYSRIYGLKTVVMRQSCIYGHRQLGVEDQGWLAHFCIAARYGKPITIYGNGKQVRDVLWIDDLIAAYDMAAKEIDVTSGQVYNIGGGRENTLSIWKEFGPLLENLAGHPIAVNFAEWRPGDQTAYISDIRKAKSDFGWQPQVSMEQGIRRLWQWVDANPTLFGQPQVEPAGVWNGRNGV